MTCGTLLTAVDAPGAAPAGRLCAGVPQVMAAWCCASRKYRLALSVTAYPSRPDTRCSLVQTGKRYAFASFKVASRALERWPSSRPANRPTPPPSCPASSPNAPLILIITRPETEHACSPPGMARAPAHSCARGGKESKEGNGGEGGARKRWSFLNIRWYRSRGGNHLNGLLRA